MTRDYRTEQNGRIKVQPAAHGSDDMQGDDTIDLLRLFYQLLENVKYIIIASLLGALIMGVVSTFFITPLYRTTAKIYVLNADSAAINLSDLQIGTYLAEDYQEVFKNWIVHERVIQTLNLPYGYDTLSDMLTVTNPTDTRIVYITVTSHDPNEAKAIADTYAKVAQEFIATTMDTQQPNLFEEALLPTAPFAPNKTNDIALGFIAGMLLACVIVSVRFITGDKIRTSEDVEKYVGLTTFGVIPRQTGKNTKISQQKKQSRTRNDATGQKGAKHEENND